ncbi:MAG: protein kinase [Chloroflexi bacterium]|nr:protein kinase [Chloroflexota bacterium]
MPSERVQRQLDRLLDGAEDALTDRDWSRVRDLAQDALALDPDNEDARTFLEAAERSLPDSASADDGEEASATSQPASSQAASPTDVSSSDSAPSSFADGRYIVKRFLGEGGKKKVFLAHDELLDRDVAFALIKTEGLDEVSRARISREAQAMGRLGSHPHIVTVFDLGEVDSSITDPLGGAVKQPFMVTELMGGGDVEAIVEDAPDHRLPLEQAINIAVETCRGLDFAHSKGIVHRDLKPGNVWLTSDGVAKIGDFGLAVAIDRSRLTQAGMMVGTVSYMPPEQAMGGETTPKADLYSLGAMLYEMVTGRPPFLGDDSVAIIGQHINTPPVAPTWHRSDCPKPLEALILRLLAKDPNERPENAKDVLTALESIDLAPSADGASATVEQANVLDSLAGGVFVGRQAEMGQLKAALEDALGGKGRMVTLVGEPGIGKTRTAQELATYAGLRGCQVLWGRCHESRGAPPYWPWIQVIRSYVREHEPQQIGTEMGSGAADIAEIVSDVRERLPGLQPATKLDDPEQARFRLFDSITAFLKSASGSKPLVVILDNLHWADKPTLLLLEFLAPELANSRLMIIGTYRDVDLSRQHPLSETLGELTRERLFERVLLRGLSQQDVDRFIEMVSGITPPRGLVQAVYTQTEGNPLFVTEVVRLLVQEGELTAERAKDRDSWDVRIPEGVREVIGRRLNRLSERCNQTLTIAAVIGREFEMQQLARLVDDPSADSGQRMSEDRLLEVLEEGLKARVIEEMPDSVDVYQFTHALIQQTLFNELTTTRRVRLHARIIEVFEELYKDNIEVHAVDLAYHAAEAESVIGPEKLVRYSKVAGDRALAAYAYEEASTHFQRALATKHHLPMDAETAAIMSSLGSAQLAMNQMAEARSNLRNLFDYYIGSGDTDRAISIAEHSHADFIVPMADVIARAVELAPPDSLQAGRVLCNHGYALGFTRDGYEPAQQAYEQALAIARRLGDTALEMRTLANSGSTDGQHFRWQECLDRSLRAIGLAGLVDDRYAKIRAHLWAAMSLLVKGEPDRARAYDAELVKTAEALRDRLWLVRSLLPSTTVAALNGDWEAARKLIDQTLAVTNQEPWFLGFRVTIEYETGNAVAGEAYLERLLELSERPGMIGDATKACVIPLVSRITGRVDRIELAEAAANTSLSSPSSRPNSAVLARVGLALMAMERGDAEAAREQYAALKPRSGEVAMFAPFSYDRILGLLAQTMGNLEDAQNHFDDALTFCRKAGYRPELAWSLCDYADMLLERSNSVRPELVEGRHGSTGSPRTDENRTKAVAMLDESLAISTELGMRPLMERVLSRRGILRA